MCGRYLRVPGKQALAEVFRATPTGDPLAYAPAYNVAPTTTQPVLRQDKEEHKRELVPMRWGLVGFGSASIDPKLSTFNARAESLTKSRLWARPLRSQRCIVIISKFYEWRKTDKVPFRIGIETDGPIGLAGLWDAWKSPEGHWLQSYSIITTEACEAMGTIHDRMPAILAPRDYDEWLDRDEIERPPFHLLHPYDSDAMRMTLAHPKVGNWRNQGPAMMDAPSGPPLNSA
jgi:putative SOS response-associated peptidase YedK